MSLLKDIEPIKTKDYLKDKFQEYYKNADITLPPRFTSREWGFLRCCLLYTSPSPRD